MKLRFKWNAKKQHWHAGLMILRDCPECGQLMAVGIRALNCKNCKEKRRAELLGARKRRLMAVGYCVVCKAPMDAGYMQSAKLICQECCWGERPRLVARAQLATRTAIAQGKLPAPVHLHCADCGNPAHVYDHLDYTQPLLVEPVCRSCNVRRGPPEGRHLQ